MICTRYMSFCEYSILTEAHAVNATTAPFAVIASDEKLPDTTPSPPASSIMLWPGENWPDVPAFGYQFGAICVVFDIPPDRVIWRGQGKYKVKDFFTERYATQRYDEIAVWQLNSRDIAKVDLSLLVIDNICLEQLKAFKDYLSICENPSEPHTSCVEAAIKVLS